MRSCEAHASVHFLPSCDKFGTLPNLARRPSFRACAACAQLSIFAELTSLAIARSRRSKADGLRAVQERRYTTSAVELLSPQGWPSPPLVWGCGEHSFKRVLRRWYADAAESSLPRSVVSCGTWHVEQAGNRTLPRAGPRAQSQSDVTATRSVQ